MTTFNTKMNTLYLILLFQVSLQLKCDKREITAHIGGEFSLICSYDINKFLYSKKYWCRGDSRNTCEILAHSEDGPKIRSRSHVTDTVRRGLFVKVTNLQFDDTGMYWVGIDKIYADIMTSVKVVITEVPVSKPGLWPLSSLADRPTCWGKPVTLRCGSAKGTGIRYAWYQHSSPSDFLLHQSSDLLLRCSSVQKDSGYYCIASNDISSKESDIISVQVLMPADSSCIYVVNIQGQPIYDCADRMSTTTVTTPSLTSCQITTTISDVIRSTSFQVNKTAQEPFFSRAWTGVPLWYTVLRWGSFLSMLIILCIFVKYINRRQKKYAKQKNNVNFRRIPHLAQ